MKLNKFTKQNLIEAISTSITIRECLNKLNLAPYGGNYRTFYKAVKHFQLDTSHFLGRSHCRGKKIGPKRPLEDYLSNKFPISSYHLKNRLLNEQVFSHKCSICENETWNQQKIPLELDHIDGNPKNNQLKNLRLLCPNCHAQTPTYRSKRRDAPTRTRTEKPIKRAEVFKTSMSTNSIIGAKKTKIDWVSNQELEKLVWQKPTSTLAKEFGVSDKAIEKRCKKFNIPKPPRGYWAKQK